MSLSAFQQALGQLIADRTFCQAVRDDASVALVDRDLSPRETRRLTSMAGARGMMASGALYRLNRLTPLRRCLPRTLAALAPTLPTLIDAFWRAYPETRLQFEEEATRFASFVEAHVAAGMIMPPLAADTLAFEAAACRLLFRSGEDAAPENSRASGLHPRVTVVRFQTKPSVVLAGDTDVGPPGEHYVVLDARGPELRAVAVPIALGRLLMTVQAGEEATDDAACQSAMVAGWMRAARQRGSAP